MHHVTLERWSRRESVLHSRDPRVKILLLLAFLIAVATTRCASLWAAAAYGGVVALGILMGRLPAGAVLARAALVLPFSLTFAAVSWLAGDSERAAALIVRSYLSAAGVLVVVGTTPLPRLLQGLEKLGAPAFLVLVVQFLYRYIFVISEQAQHMRQAAACRGGGARPRQGFRAAAGAVAVLFARSYSRAEGIHQAMLARGFEGRFEALLTLRLTRADIAFAMAGIALLASMRLWLGRIG